MSDPIAEAKTKLLNAIASDQHEYVKQQLSELIERDILVVEYFPLQTEVTQDASGATLKVGQDVRFVVRNMEYIRALEKELQALRAESAEARDILERTASYTSGQVLSDCGNVKQPDGSVSWQIWTNPLGKLYEEMRAHLAKHPPTPAAPVSEKPAPSICTNGGEHDPGEPFRTQDTFPYKIIRCKRCGAEKDA